MSAVATVAVSAVESAMYKLRDALASGDERRVDKAAKQLERARESAARESQRAKDRADAEQKVAAEKRDRARAEKKAASDQAEAELREQTPEIVFTCGGKRVTVRLSVPGIDAGWANEAARRIVWAITREFSERVVASRNTGVVAPERPWLDELMSDHTHGIGAHVARGVCRVEDAK